MTIHLLRMAVGIESIANLKQIQSDRLIQSRVSNEKKLYTITRNFPKKVEDLLDGGSIYWVIKKYIRVRQSILGIERRKNKDGKPYCAIQIDPILNQVIARRQKAFQGWRYLKAEDKPIDLQISGEKVINMPVEMVDELRELGLI